MSKFYSLLNDIINKLNSVTASSAPTKTSELDNDSGFVDQSEVEALIKSIVLDGYMGGKKIRYVEDTNDGGLEGYLTVKKG